MIDLFIKLCPVFTKEDKDKCRSVIKRVLFLTETARRKGVLALETEASDETEYFLKMSVSLIVDGTDPEIVKGIMKAAIVSGNYSGEELLKRLLIAEGVLMLQKGENPRIILMKLTAMMGEEYMRDEENEYYSLETQTKDYYGYLYSLKDKKALPECYEFEKFLSQFSPRDLQFIFKHFKHEEIFAVLSGCGYEMTVKTLDNLSFNICLSVIKMRSLAKLPTDYILSCQRAVTEKIYSLRSTGEIIIRRELA